jgi:hypothetical protein
MSSSSGKSIDELRDEAARNREMLASTVGELKDRVSDATGEIRTITSPSYIKEEVSSFVRRERESLTDELRRRARENPLQAAAVAVAAAYPILRLAKAVPTPLWLIGAGLFLTSRRGQSLAADAQDRLSTLAESGRERAAETMADAREAVADAAQRLQHKAAEAGQSIASSVEATKDTAVAALHDARDAAKDVAGTLRDKADSMAEQVQSAVGGVEERTSQFSGQVSTRRVKQIVTDNALLFGGLGLIAGAMIAASIPASSAENRLFGSTATRLRAKAREGVNTGVEALGEKALDAFATVKEAAAEEGLDAEYLANGLDETAEAVRDVAERGIDSVFRENGAGRRAEPHEGSSSFGRNFS